MLIRQEEKSYKCCRVAFATRHTKNTHIVNFNPSTPLNFRAHKKSEKIIKIRI